MIECVEWGGCGRFVWSVYALGIGTILGLGIWPLISLGRTRKSLAERARLEMEHTDESGREGSL